MCKKEGYEGVAEDNGSTKKTVFLFGFDSCRDLSLSQPKKIYGSKGKANFARMFFENIFKD